MRSSLFILAAMSLCIAGAVDQRAFGQEADGGAAAESADRRRIVIEDWSRQAVEVPDAVWDQAVREIGFSGAVGITPDEQFRIHKPDNTLKVVEEAMCDARNVSRTTGRMSTLMTKDPAVIRDRVFRGFAFLGVAAGRDQKAPEDGSWGIDGVEDGATPEAAFRALLEDWEQAGIDLDVAGDAARFAELPSAVKRLVVRLSVAFAEGDRWLREALGPDLLEEIAEGRREELFQAVFPLSSYAKNEESPTRRSYEIVEAFDLGFLSLASTVFFAHVDAALAEWRAAEAEVEIPGRLELCSFQSPYGRIEIGAGIESRSTTGTAIAIDLAGDTSWTDTGALASPHSMRLLLDFGGNDTYRSEGMCTLGSGCFGISALYDFRGADVYDMGDVACGAGYFGTGVLADYEGDDKYNGAATEHSQGSASFGLGVLLDAEGDDEFTCCTMSQGFGGPSGAGYIIDLAGNDVYVATDQHHSDLYNATVNFSQGAGWGRRHDFGNGHQLAGGIGGMIDAAGDDQYTGHIWTQAVGYWWALGFIEDLGGDDTYTTQGDTHAYYAQGNAVHYGVASFFDLTGNDKHIRKTRDGRARGACFGYAADRSVTSFIDAGGDDLYDTGAGSRHTLGFCKQTGASFFWDRLGADHYRLGEAEYMCLGSGQCRPDRDYSSREDLFSRALFLDTQGTDTYELYPFEENGKKAPEADVVGEAGNDAVWRRSIKGAVPNGEGGGMDGEYFKTK